MPPSPSVSRISKCEMVRPTMSSPRATNQANAQQSRDHRKRCYGSTTTVGSLSDAVAPVALLYEYALHPASPLAWQATLIVQVLPRSEPNSPPSAHGLSSNFTYQGLEAPVCRNQVTLWPTLTWRTWCFLITLPVSSICSSCSCWAKAWLDQSSTVPRAMREK